MVHASRYFQFRHLRTERFGLKYFHKTTLKSLIQEQTEISKPAGIFSEIPKRVGQNKQAGENFF